MKANKQITAILTVLFIGFSTLNGQASARTGNSDKQKGHTIKKTEARQVQQRQTQARQTQAKQVQTKQVQTKQTPKREVYSRPSKANQAQARQTQARQAQVKNTQSREVHTNSAKARQTQPYRVQSREVHPNPSKARQTTAKAYKNPDQRSSTRYDQTASRPVMANNKPNKISTPNHTKTNYGGGHVNRPMKENKFSEKRYYSGHYYHHAYPSTKIRTRYHHDTHIHHYNVLYYPAYHEIYWNHSMYRDYNRWYPNYRWRYDYGYRIQTISIFDAKYNLGEVAMVYGRVYASWHNKETDDYLLFFGGDYPAQQFTVVLPGRIARKFSWRPERYFLGEHMTVTGLITTFDGIPELIVKNRTQIGIY